LAKAHGEQVFQAGFVSRIQVKELLNRYAGFFFLRFHAPNIHPNDYLCQGDNSVILRFPENPPAAAIQSSSPFPCADE
jgi:hypothetical protein